MISIIGFAIAGVLLCYIWSSRLVRWTRQRGYLDVPNNRSSHVVPTPRGGGIAIVGLTIGLWVVYLIMTMKYDSPFMVFAIAGLQVALMGWVDDIRHVWRSIRFLVHSIVAVLAIYAFGYFDEIILPFIGVVQLSWVGLPITFLWITGMINVYNFMDGIDGMAGGQAVVAGVGWIIIGSTLSRPEIGVIGLIVASVCLGFLILNWHPARIFMGDVGSSFLGYTFALIPLMYHDVTPAISLTAALLVWPFLFDGVFTILRRAIQGKNIFVAHHEFLFQRLIDMGWSHLRVVSVYICLEVVGGLLAWTWMFYPGLRGAIICTALVHCAGLWTLIVSVEDRRKHRRTEDTALRVRLASSGAPVSGMARIHFDILRPVAGRSYPDDFVIGKTRLESDEEFEIVPVERVGKRLYRG